MSSAPAPVTIWRIGRCPLRTTRRRPCSSTRAACSSRKSCTSFSRAACNIFLAPSRTKVSSGLRVSSATWKGTLSKSTWMAETEPRSLVVTGLVASLFVPCRMVAYPFLPRGGAAENIFQQQDTPPLSFLHLSTTFDNTSVERRHLELSIVRGNQQRLSRNDDC